MSKGYGNKYNKKIIQKIQQNHLESKHILCISPQVLAYSFQYLSFKESSKIESVCSYFTYINRKYEALSHFYINLNHKFWTRVMRNQININRLIKFKHICIASTYEGKDSWEKSVRQRAQLFVHILNFIISKLMYIQSQRMVGVMDSQYYIIFYLNLILYQSINYYGNEIHWQTCEVNKILHEYYN